MESKSGTQHGAHHDAVIIRRHVLRAERSGDGLVGIIERTAHFICHGTGNSFEIATEQRSVSLNVDVAELGHVAIDDRGAVAKIDYFHFVCVMSGVMSRGIPYSDVRFLHGGTT